MEGCSQSRVEGWRVRQSTGKHSREAASTKPLEKLVQRCEWSAQRDHLVLNMSCPPVCSVCLSSFLCSPH